MAHGYLAEGVQPVAFELGDNKASSGGKRLNFYLRKFMLRGIRSTGSSRFSFACLYKIIAAGLIKAMIRVGRSQETF
jgi:hypothetical protein